MKNIKNRLLRLSNLADLLDKNNLYNEAHIIDLLIEKFANEHTEEAKKGVEKVCRNCKKSYKGKFEGWHAQFCSRFCKERFNQKHK